MANSSKDAKVLIATSTFGVYDHTPLERLIEAGFGVIKNPYKRRLTKKEILELLSKDVKG